MHPLDSSLGLGEFPASNVEVGAKGVGTGRKLVVAGDGDGDGDDGDQTGGGGFLVKTSGGSVLGSLN